MMSNPLKQRLQNGGVAAGIFVAFPSPDVVEMCGYLGFDFVSIDAEHGPMNVETCAHMIRAAEVAGIVPIVRTPINMPQVIMRYLDIGAMGIQVPQINSREEAVAVVQAVKYYPEGHRGLARPRSAHYGLRESVTEYIERSNRETMIIAHIENVAGVKHLPEILSVEGIDVFFIGPSDLSQSMGLPGQPDAPLVQGAIEAIISQVHLAGRWVGIFVGDEKQALEMKVRGIQYIAAGTTLLFAQAARHYLKTLRGG